MKKRGQVTTFMIIGFVIVVVIVLIFSLRHVGIGVDPSSYLDSKMNVIEKDVKDCNREVLNEVSEIIGKQGGTSEPIKYRMHDGYKVNYLCYNIPEKPECLNNMIFNNDVEQEIEEYLNYEVPECAELDKLSSQPFFPEIGSANFESHVEIRDNTIFVEIDYPVTLKKGNQELTLSKISQIIDSPLGNLLDTTYDIVNAEARDGLFMSVPYMIANRGAVEIYVDQQEYPDKIYVLNERNSDYIFQFAIEGESL